MDQELLYFILVRVLALSTDGIVWCIGVRLFITRFFGYPEKKNSYGKMAAFIVITANTFISALFFWISRSGGTEFNITNGPLLLSIIVYFMINLNEKSKVKRFFIIFFSMNILTDIFNLLGGLFGVVSLDGMENKVLKIAAALGLVLAQQLSTLTFIILISKTSCKKRKEPMGFSLVLTAFIFSLLLDTVMNFFNVTGYGQIDPMVTVRMLFREDDVDKAVAFIVLLFILLAVIVFFFMLIRESESAYFHKKSTVSEYYLEAQKAHYENLVESNREIRRLRHDMKNHIYCLRELSQNGKYKELTEYLDGISERFAAAVPGIQVGNEIADAIILEKMSKALANDITINVEGGMFDLDLKAIDTCTVFANLLDNAMEAVSELPAKYRKIELELKKNKNYYLISERNLTDKKAEIIDNEIASTKKDKKNHGFGIINIKDAVSKYDGECFLSISDEADENGCYTFTFDIMIPIKQQYTNRKT